ncbi:hypothetical protein DUNSADRAFT_5131 [Dunaliella salina]|uniref:tRNA-dihydrouridine(47) synthase [NAD(P)(+)] n=1 Tax=Dunaliella salina TaxID=3046 RepID=A0ABQ7H7E8_DUNSA|nr:hypothetical protein DUNSADRAFT_5131 [Dunaliella salina]|eukprot:KAF5842759.1 hypothetical protein DUNSADRAFT_5131 [Dunaliella salina]
MAGISPEEEEKISRCIAPIKAEFVVPKNKIESVAGQQAAPAPAAEVKPKQSKRQQRKEAKSHKPICHNFLVGRCSSGDGCQYVHDLEGFVKAKGADLPGRCPFSSMESCPYGIGCRYLGSHSSQDPLQQQAKAIARANSINVQGEGGTAATVQGQEHGGSLELPVASCVQPPLNALDKNVQHLLWKNRYDFTKADDVLRSMNLKITYRAAKATKADKGSGKGQQGAAGGQQKGETGVQQGQSANAQQGKADVQLGKAGGQQAHGEEPQGGAGPQQGAEQQLQPQESQSAKQQGQDPVQQHKHEEQEGASEKPETQAQPAPPGASRSTLEGAAAAPAQREGAQGSGPEPMEDAEGCAPAPKGSAQSPAPAPEKGGQGSAPAAGNCAQASAPAPEKGAQGSAPAAGNCAQAPAPARMQDAQGSAPTPMEDAQGSDPAPMEEAQGAGTGGLQAEQEGRCAKKQRLEGGEGVATAGSSAPGSLAAAASSAPAGAGSGSVTDTRSVHVETPLRREEKKVVDFKNKTILAPLTTVGNLPFRRICKQFGADVTVGEMALATNLLQGHASEWALLKRHPCEDIFGVQIAGGFPDSIARTCQLIDETCPAVDFVDINCGCPIDLVCDKGAGSALLLRPRKLEDIARAADRAMSLPLTIKTRKGYYDDADVTHTFVKNIRSWGPIALTLHGRTRQQRYSKLADWDYIVRCAEAAAPSKLQLIGNGDVLSFTDWNEHMRISSDGSSSALASCMIGRGALIKPWLFQEIKEQRHIDISASERLEMLKSFAAAGLQHWGSDTRGVETTRRFLLELLSYLHRYIPVGLMEVLPQKLNWRPPTFFGRNDLETLFASESPADWIRISEMLLGKVPSGFTFTPKHKSNSYSAPANGSAAAPPTGAGYEADDVAEG